MWVAPFFYLFYFLFAYLSFIASLIYYLFFIVYVWSRPLNKTALSWIHGVIEEN